MLGGPRASLDGYAKFRSHSPGFDPRTVHPVQSHTDYTGRTPLHTVLLNIVRTTTQNRACLHWIMFCRVNVVSTSFSPSNTCHLYLVTLNSISTPAKLALWPVVWPRNFQPFVKPIGLLSCWAHHLPNLEQDESSSHPVSFGYVLKLACHPLVQQTSCFVVCVHRSAALYGIHEMEVAVAYFKVLRQLLSEVSTKTQTPNEDWRPERRQSGKRPHKVKKESSAFIQ